LVGGAAHFDPGRGPAPLCAPRLARIADANAEPELASLIEEQRARVEQDLAYALRAPLELAVYLASSIEPQTTKQPLRERGELLGFPTLPDPDVQPTTNAVALLTAAIPELLDTRAAVLLLSPDQAPPPDTATPDPGQAEAAQPDAEQPAAEQSDAEQPDAEQPEAERGDAPKESP
jgi:hypothetical protein